jgi:DUF3072 family protein
MTDQRQDRSQPLTPTGPLDKDPDEWVTGDEAMTRAQASYLKTLAAEAGESVDARLTKADASKRIDELQKKTGRGKPDAKGGDGGDTIRENETEEAQPPEPRHDDTSST